METLRTISPIDPRWQTPNFESYNGNRDVYTKRLEESYDTGFRGDLDRSIAALKQKDELMAEAVTYETKDENIAQRLYNHLKGSRNVFLMERELKPTVTMTKGEKAAKTYRMSALTKQGDVQSLDRELEAKGLQRAKQSVTQVSIERNKAAKNFFFPQPTKPKYGFY